LGLSALAIDNSAKYGKPNDAFKMLADVHSPGVIRA
jgi:hypothetical protein